MPEGVTGLDVFLESLGNLGPEFLESLHPSSLQSAIQADEKIVQSSQLMRLAATLPYRATFPESPELAMWGGLSLFSEQPSAEAAQYLLFALQSHRIEHPERLFWYLAIASAGCQDTDTMRTALDAFCAQASDTEYAEALHELVPSNVARLAGASVTQPTFVGSDVT